jgi:hypothetical protein
MNEINFQNTQNSEIPTQNSSLLMVTVSNKQNVKTLKEIWRFNAWCINLKHII